jgi:fatty acid desaturase
VSRPTLLAILSLPAAAIGYAATAAILTSLQPVRGGPADLLFIFVPLLVAGLCMVPFLIPFVDRMAKRDLEAHRAATAAADRPPSHPDAPED